MSLSQKEIDTLRERLNHLGREADEHFGLVDNWISDAAHPDRELEYKYRNNPLWACVDAQHRAVAVRISDTFAELVNDIVVALKDSSLTSESDLKDLRIALREVLSSLKFRRFRHWDAHAVSDEDRFLYVEPAGQEEDDISLSEAHRAFARAFQKIEQLSKLIFPSGTPLATAIARSGSDLVKRYRPNTAFIMMWISKDHPELDDVKECIKNGFKEFGIEAVRSDEIEHQGVITERILDEISSSEFQIADLTGERPSVYYEVGYAHAIGKRPILYRKAGTPLHFDLSVHNAPEYENIRDLHEKLRNRLSAITNRSIGGAK
jgi:hypothetical protein